MSSTSRQLAAIMFTDIVGYSALMGKDEKKGLEILRRSKEIQKPLVDKHNGKWLKEMGDGTLTSFTTASDAVICAMEIQKKCHEEKVLDLRIGIHLGEIVVEEGDIFGDGVNIASRLQEQADTGGVYISDAVHKAIRSNSAIEHCLLGELELKNVDYPIKTYALVADFLPKPEPISGKSSPNGGQKDQKRFILIATIIMLALAGTYFLIETTKGKTDDSSTLLSQLDKIKSIAIIPLANLSNDTEQDYFSLGITEAILNNLVKIPNLGVISRTTMMQYRESELTIPEIANEVKARYIVEGSVQKSQKRVRITVQLIDGQSDLHIWSNSYDRDLKDIFEIQNEVALEIARNLKLQISPEVENRMQKIGTQSAEAYDLMLQFETGYRAGWNIGTTRNEYDLLEKVISLDPSYADPYSHMGLSLIFEAGVSGGANPRDVAEKGKRYLEAALRLDPYSGAVHQNLANYYLWIEKDFESALTHMSKAREYEPSNTEVLTSQVDLFLAIGNVNQAVQNITSVIELEPSDYRYSYVALAHAFAGSDISIINQATEKALSGRYSAGSHSETARAHLIKGDYSRVKEILGMYDKSDSVPRMIGLLAIANYKLGDRAKSEAHIDQLVDWSERTAGGSPSFYLAMTYAVIEQPEEAFKWLEKSYVDNEIELYWMKAEPEFKTLYDDPRWQEMLERIGFP